MKKILVCLLVTVSFVSHAQKSLKLKMAYQPNTEYSIDVSNIMNMEMNAELDSATKEQMAMAGMSFPLQLDMNKNMTAVLTIGALNNQKETPFTMEYTKINQVQRMGGKELPGGESPLQGLKAMGWVDQNAKLRIDSVSGAGLSEEVKKVMLATFDQIGTQVNFPDKSLKVGDEFTQEVPLNMPVGNGAAMKMSVKTVFKLISFDKKNAFFDTIVTMALDMTMEEQGGMNAEGSGNGKAIYDINKNFMSDYTVDLDMKMRLLAGPMDMDIKANSKSITKVTLK